jgi:alginate O-acetyltransferase complex protein AlgJ
VLVLGDSFSNIYSLEAMGWGAAAGFVEQLGYELQQPVDAILRNDAGAFATRELLAKDLARGKDRLAGKKVLVWEFAMRELGVGDWKIIELPQAATAASLPEKTSEGFFAPGAGEIVEIEATVQSRSVVPKPGTVPYKDQVFSVHLTGLQGQNVPAGHQAVVYLFGMKDNKLTGASEWKPGQRVKIKLKAWEEVASQYERFNRSELDDADLQLETPCWGEPAE